MKLVLGDMGEAGGLPAVIPAAGPTWGIEGPDFLEWYLNIGFILAVIIFALRLFTGGLLSVRKRIDPHSLLALDLAFLSGGPFHATAISLWLWRSMKSGGQGPEERQLMEANWHHPLLQAAAGPAGNSAVTVQECLQDPSVKAQLEIRHNELARQGLLRSPRVMRGLRYLRFAALAYLGLGVLRVISGIFSGQDTDFLVGTVFVGVFAFFVLIVKVRTITVPGKKLLDSLRAENRDLRPGNTTSYSGIQPARVAIGAALFGTSGLWLAAPAYAAAMGVPAAGAASTTGGSGYGGDSGSSSGSGSGGGSSCSGGCGGCGG